MTRGWWGSGSSSRQLWCSVWPQLGIEELAQPHRAVLDLWVLLGAT